MTVYFVFSLESPQQGDSNKYTQYMYTICVFSLESPQHGDSIEYTQYTISQYGKEILNL